MLLAARVTSKGSPSTTFSPPKWSSLTANTLTEASNDWAFLKGAGSSLTTMKVEDAFALDAVDTATDKVVEPSASTTRGNTSTKLKGDSKSTDSNVSGALPWFNFQRHHSFRQHGHLQTDLDVAKWNWSNPHLIVVWSTPGWSHLPRNQSVFKRERNISMRVLRFKRATMSSRLPRKRRIVGQAEQHHAEHSGLHGLNQRLQSIWQLRRPHQGA